ncbi:hypothetical protein Ct61P_04716 [Colletotrichum tofieldiae]|nr:hypothetical protein Ct61P_04716 [Colletotrichum tofieldiae]
MNRWIQTGGFDDITEAQEHMEKERRTNAALHPSHSRDPTTCTSRPPPGTVLPSASGRRICSLAATFFIICRFSAAAASLRPSTTSDFLSTESRQLFHAARSSLCLAAWYCGVLRAGFHASLSSGNAARSYTRADVVNLTSSLSTSLPSATTRARRCSTADGAFPVVAVLLRRPRPPVVLAEVPHGGLQARDLALEGVHLARRRHGPLLAGLGARRARAVRERLAVARNLLPLVAVRLQRLELAVLLVNVLLEAGGLLLGRLDLRLEVLDAGGLGVSVLHPRLERLDLEVGRAEVLVTLRNGPARLVVLLLKAAQILLRVDGNSLDRLELLGAELPGAGLTSNSCVWDRSALSAAKSEIWLVRVRSLDRYVEKRSDSLDMVTLVVALEMVSWTSRLAAALLVQERVQVEANLPSQSSKLAGGILALLEGLLGLLRQHQRSGLEILQGPDGLAGDDLGAPGLVNDELRLLAEVLRHLVVLGLGRHSPLDHGSQGSKRGAGRFQVALHDNSLHVSVLGEIGQLVGKVHLGEMRHERDRALEFVRALLLFEFVPAQAVDPSVQCPLHGLQLEQGVLEPLELLNRAVADGVGEPLAHGRDPRKLINGVATGEDVILVAGVRLAVDALLDERLQELRLESESSEPQQSEHRILVLLVRVGEEHLDYFQVLLGFLSLQSSQLQVDGLDLGLGSGDLELQVQVHHGAGFAVELLGLGLSDSVRSPHVLEVALQAGDQASEAGQSVLHVLQGFFLLACPSGLLRNDAVLEVELLLHLLFVLDVINLQFVVDLLEVLEILDDGFEFLDLLRHAHVPLGEFFNHVLGTQSVVQLLSEVLNGCLGLGQLVLCRVKLLLDGAELFQVVLQSLNLVLQFLLLLLCQVAQPQ